MKIKNTLTFTNLFPIGLLFVIAILILIFGASLPEKIPMFYSLPWGETQLASKLQLLIIPSIGLIIVLFNLLIFWQLHQTQILFKRTLIATNFVISIILFATFIKIVFIFI